MSVHININSDPARIQYVGNSVNTEYEINFPVFKEEYIQIFFNDEQVSFENYNIEIYNNNKAKIIFKTPPEEGCVITILRTLSIKRNTDFQEGGPLRADALNYEFEYQMGCLQELADNLNRSMVIPPYAIDPDVKLTLPSPNPGKSIMWSSDGKNLENSDIEINTISKELEEKLIIAKTAAETANTASILATQKANEAITQADLAAEKANEINNNFNSKANVVDTRKLVESYQNESSWYKIFEEYFIDGTKKYWCEQGGYIPYSSGTVTTSFLIPFIDTNYFIIKNVGIRTNSSAYYTYLGFYELTSINALSNQVSQDKNSCWYACGYINKPEGVE